MFVLGAYDSRKYTDFNEPERLQLEDAMLIISSEALIPFILPLHHGCCMMSTRSYNSSTDRVESS